jgi:hypothetical protein
VAKKLMAKKKGSKKNNFVVSVITYSQKKKFDFHLQIFNLILRGNKKKKKEEN